jgi:phage terminase large subunit-like protein
MPKAKETKLDIGEAFRTMSEEFRSRAAKPNIFGYQAHYKQNIFHSHGQLSLPKGTRGLFPELLPKGQINNKELLKLVRLYIGGNRSGKTVGGIVEDIWWATKTHPYIDIDSIWPEPIRGRVVTTNFKDGWEKIIRPEFVRWCPLTYLRGNSWATAFDKETKTINFADRAHPTIKGRIIRGGFIEIMTHEQDLETFAGASRHFVHADEELDEDRYKECISRLIDTGGCFWMTMTPVEGMTWSFDTIYEPGLENDDHQQFLIIEVDLFDNPFLSEAERDNVISLWDGDDAEARIHGKFVRKGGLIYADFSDDKTAKLCHVVEPDIPPKEYLWVVSMDHGLKNPSAWYWHAVNYEGRVLTFWEYYQSNRVISEHATKVQEINRQLGREPEYYVGDPSIRNKMPNTGVSIFEEYMQHGLIIQHQDYLNDVKPGIERVTRYLRTVDRESDGTEVPYWQITRNCTKLIWELKRYRWRTFVNRKSNDNNNPPEQPVKKDDHACDSCRYFFMSRVDLRQIRGENKDPWDDELQRKIDASQIYSRNAPEYNVDENLIKTAGEFWTQDDASSGNQQWETEEFLGGEW